MRIAAALAMVVALAAPSPATAQTKLLRFPAIHGDRLAFTWGAGGGRP